MDELMKLAHDNVIVHQFYSHWIARFCTLEQALIGMVQALVKQNTEFERLLMDYMIKTPRPIIIESRKD